MTGLPPSTSPPFNRLLIVRLSAMGDIIHTLPAATLLRRAFPNAILGWLVEERWIELLNAPNNPPSGVLSAQRPLVDRIHTVATKDWRRAPLTPNTWREMSRSIGDLRAVHYDAVFDFQGAIRSALLARLSGAPIIFGSTQPRENLAKLFYTTKVPMHQTHVVEQALDLAAALAPPSPTNLQVEFPVDAAAESKIATFIANKPRIAILNPGAGWGAKRWPAERFGEVAQKLAQDGLSSLVNYGPGEEQLAVAVENAGNGAARKVSCSISELIALTRRASLFIGGDTGPLHLSAALNVPVVAIFGPTNPARNGPFATRSIVLRSATSITDHSRHQAPEQGLLEITTEQVVDAARKLLQNQTADPSQNERQN